MNRRPPWTFDIHLTCYHFIDDTHKITLIASSIERFNAVISTDGLCDGLLHSFMLRSRNEWVGRV